MSLSPAPFLAAPFQAVHLAQQGKVLARYRAAFIPVPNKVAEEYAVEFAVQACELLVKKHCLPVSFGAEVVTATEIPPAWADINVKVHGTGSQTERIASVDVFVDYEVKRQGEAVTLVASKARLKVDPEGVVHWGHMLNMAAAADVNVHDASAVLHWLASADQTGHPFVGVWAVKMRPFLHNPEAWANIVIDYYGRGNWQVGSPSIMRPQAPFPRSMEGLVP